ncbi:MAG: protein kinase domain-containing protein [Planctomycetota bacterium]|jgi:serine/threonine-protein kinase
MAAQMDDNQANVLEEALTRFMGACSRGEQPDIDEFIGQYPQYEAQLKKRIQDLQEIDSLFDSLVRADESDFENSALRDDLIGRRIGSFEITEVIGRGGMGVVYLAHDTKLKRPVAIKSMPAKLATGSTARMRFRREAELLASLNHPNIAAIYDIVERGDSAGYLILEYVPGETLIERIRREPLKLEEALSIARQIALAISAAHEKGVIHRDLKPGNIKVALEGRIKVLDFGLAKPSVNKSTDIEITSTKPGHIIGTPAYMSPEQARGESTDLRTDIWSFGCIVYQMLTGHLPFEGKTATDTLARIIERQPNWELLPNETPEDVCVLLRRCLEKNQDERLGDIAEAAAEIGEAMNLPAAARPAALRSRWRLTAVIGLVVVAIVVGLKVGRWREQLPGRVSPDRIESLAVLPLKNLTGDPNQEYFADSMTDVLISDLGTIGVQRVISRQSVMQYKGSDKPLAEITRRLNADAVVEGSVLSVEESVRMTVRLVSPMPERQLWSHKYDRDFGDILILSGEVAQAIARRIGITPTPEQEALLASTRPVNRETLMAYFMGMFHLNKMTPEGAEKGLGYLRQAIEKDPSDPLAYGGLALGYAESAHGPGAGPDAFARAEAAALKALELDETLTEAHAALANVKLYRDWEWEAAEQAFQRALKLDPSLTMTRAHYSWYLVLFGRMEEALTEMRRVQEVDPLTPLWSTYLGTQYLWVGQYEEAIEEIRKSLELDPDFVYGLHILGRAYAEMGMYEEAVKANQKVAALGRAWRSDLGYTYAKAGRQDEARLVLAELEADLTPWDTLFIAHIYAVLGETDQAFRCIEAAYGPPHHPYLPWIKHFPALKSLRDDPRFGDLLRRMNLPE